VSGVREWVDSTPDFSGIDANWPADLKPDGVVHLAACVHMLNDDAADPEAVFQSTNVEGALRVARAAVRHGARRFVFVGSLLFLAMGGSRAHYRASKEFYLYGGLVGQGKPVVMLGAGNAGASLARELSRSSEWRLVAG
jgi:FlaA1/EpsC-like NDP-sugar epimerase